MSLSEGKMFTIEALKRIEGFVWPSDAKFAAMNGYLSLKLIQFYALKPSVGEYSFSGVEVVTPDVVANDKHPDWQNSLITREEFESVDGWVRNTTLKLPPELIDSQIEVLHHNGEIAFDDANAFYWDENVDKWRYHKPQKQEVKPESESIETMIRRYKDSGENKRAAIDKLNKAQADVEQAEALEDGLFMAIEAWAESHGFDIRVLSESEEKPELVITDWRDLQVGDVIECVGSWEGENTHALRVEVTNLEEIGYEGDFPIQVRIPNPMHGNSLKWGLGFKFIRRPEKK